MHSVIAGLLPAVPASRPVPVISIPSPVNPVGTLIGNGVLSGAESFLRSLADDFLRSVAAPLARYLVRTPDLMAEPGLRHEWLVSLGCLFAVAALLVAVCGVAMSTGAGGRLAIAARHALGVRLVAGLLTAVVSLPLVALEVRLANVCAVALLPSGADGGAAAVLAPLRQAVDGDAGAGLAVLVTAVVGVALLVLLVVVSLIRWATIWLLVVLAPVAMGFATLPGAADLSRLWWRLQLTAVFLPLGYAALLGTYAAMFGSVRTGFLGALSGVAVLALMTKLPVWAAGLAFNVEVRDLMHPLSGPSRRRRISLRSA